MGSSLFFVGKLVPDALFVARLRRTKIKTISGPQAVMLKRFQHVRQLFSLVFGFP